MSYSDQTRTRTKVHCYCRKCGGRLVDPRTRDQHKLKYTYAINGPSNIEPSNAMNNFVNDDYQEAGPSNIEPSYARPPYAVSNNGPLFEKNFSFLTKRMPIDESAKTQKVKKGNLPDQILLSDDDDDDFEDVDDEDGDSEDFVDDEDSDSEDENEVVNFASPGFDDYEPINPIINTNCNYTWIILWILKYQQRYKLSNVAIDSLFKFIRFFLLMVDENKFSSFPSSLYMAKKMLGISTKIIIKYTACSVCHKLHGIRKISNETDIPTCSFVNHPNHSIERFRQKCNNPLFKKIDSNNPIFRPIKTFPLINIKQQLTLFFCRKKFEMSCRKWAERKNETEALFDIYDGAVWKNFKDENAEPFFTKEFADSHIGLMLNMDWFQPFTNSPYSVGVIYAVICNLPRSERFNPHNILTLAVMPGPKEPRLHEINNYLYPIVNQLNWL